MKTDLEEQKITQTKTFVCTDKECCDTVLRKTSDRANEWMRKNSANIAVIDIKFQIARVEPNAERSAAVMVVYTCAVGYREI